MQIQNAINLFLNDLTRQNFSPETVRTRKDALTPFARFCTRTNIFSLAEILPTHLESYVASVHAMQKENGAALSVTRKRVLLISLKLFYRFLGKENLILTDPLAKLAIPNLKNKLPAAFLSERQAQEILAAVDLMSEMGVRDRAILEVLYSTGIRRKELVQLKIGDVDFVRGVLWIRQGKMAKDRVVPIGETALLWLRRYLEDLRVKKLNAANAQILFIGRRGKALSKVLLGQMVRKYICLADIKTPGACHLFRHSMATHMLRHGADVRHLKEILGHASLSTTAIYTRVEITTLDREYAHKHPGRV